MDPVDVYINQTLIEFNEVWGPHNMDYVPTGWP